MTVILHKYLTLLLFILCLFTSSAQNPHYIVLDQQNGLPNNTIYYTFQDSKGFVWLTTNSGLYKYDGVSYKNYVSKKQTSLPGSEIYEDVYGRIWYVNFDGYLYYVENEQLKNLVQKKPIAFIPYGLTTDYLFVLQPKGIDVYDLKTLKCIRTLAVPTNMPEHSLAQGTDFYYSNNGVIYRVDKNLNVTSNHFFQHKNLKQIFFYPYKNKFFIASKFNEEKEIYLFDRNLTFEKSISIPEINFVQRADYIDGIFWIHTPQGVFGYDINGKLLFKNGLFPNNNSSRVFKDHLNNYWFTSLNNGIYVVPKLNDYFYSLGNHIPLKIIPNDEGYLIGTAKGEILTVDNNFITKKVQFNNQEKLATNFLYYDNQKKNLFFTDRGFSLVENNKYSSIKKYSIALKDIIRIDDSYYAFAATGFGGLLKKTYENDKNTSVWDDTFVRNLNENKNYPDVAQLLSNVRAKSVAYDSINKHIYFATNIGLYQCSPSTQKEIKVNNESIYASHVYFHENLLYYLDTKGHIFALDERKKIIDIQKYWNVEETTFEIFKKDENNLIAANKESVFIYSLKDKTLNKHFFDMKGSKINDVLVLNSQIIILTNNGVLQLNLKNRVKKIKPIFHINAFSVNNKFENWSTYQKFAYNQNTISIHFSLIEFGDKSTPLYYRINGNEWNKVSKTNREIQFPSLSSGDYFIEFKLGEKISDKKIHFKITVAFWKTWWFYLLCSLALILLLYLYFTWQYKMMVNQLHLLHEKVELEKNLSKSMLASIKSQMNPHFFYNALNTIQAYIFTNDKFKANAYLSKFSRLTRMILEMSEKETITLEEEITSLKLYIDLEQMRFTDSFTYEITTDNIIDLSTIKLPPMLIQPFVENAIKHGLLPKEDNKKLNIDFSVEEKKLIVRIDDNGIGRKKAEEINQMRNEKHISFSSKANEKRLEILNKGNNNKIGLKYIDKVNEKTKESYGTTVVLFIPL